MIIAPADPLFCDVEQLRKFSQEELDWRALHAPWNLRRDFHTNLVWDANCAPAKSPKAVNSDKKRTKK